MPVGDVTVDEGPRRDTSYEKLSRLKPVFDPEGTTTAGNAPGVNDGAGALVVTSDEFAKRRGSRCSRRSSPQAYVADDFAYLARACEGRRAALMKAGKKIDEVERVELNEAFSSVVLELREDARRRPERVNVNGGAVALGHPIGASAHASSTMIYELRRNGGGLGLAAICSGGGQGDALLIEAGQARPGDSGGGPGSSSGPADGRARDDRGGADAPVRVRGGVGRGRRDRLRERIEHSGKLVDGWLDFGIEADGRLVGDITARSPKNALPPGVSFEVGITLFQAPTAVGALVAKPSELMTTHLFEAADAGRVQATTAPDNVAMRRVLEALGFVHEGDLAGVSRRASTAERTTPCTRLLERPGRVVDQHDRPVDRGLADLSPDGRIDHGDAPAVLDLRVGETADELDPRALAAKQVEPLPPRQVEADALVRVVSERQQRVSAHRELRGSVGDLAERPALRVDDRESRGRAFLLREVHSADGEAPVADPLAAAVVALDDLRLGLRLEPVPEAAPDRDRLGHSMGRRRQVVQRDLDDGSLRIHQRAPTFAVDDERGDHLAGTDVVTVSLRRSCRR